MAIDMKGYEPMMEEICKTILRYQPEKMGLVMIDGEGNTITQYLNKNLTLPAVSLVEKAGMAFMIQNDCTWQTIENNGELLREIMEDDDEPGTETENETE